MLLYPNYLSTLTINRYLTLEHHSVLYCPPIQVTTLPIVPPVMVFLAKSDLVQQYDVSSLQRANCGAAPLDLEIERTFQRKLGIDKVNNGNVNSVDDLDVVIC